MTRKFLSELTVFRHTQGSANTTWTITHNLNTEAPCVDVWVDDGGTNTKIIPDTVTATSADVVTLTFTTSRSGIAIVA